MLSPPTLAPPPAASIEIRRRLVAADLRLRREKRPEDFLLPSEGVTASDSVFVGEFPKLVFSSPEGGTIEDVSLRSLWASELEYDPLPLVKALLERAQADVGRKESIVKVQRRRKKVREGPACPWLLLL